jgi:hypothetical protein
MPYEDLREAIYDGRIEFPPYVTYINKGDNNAVQIAVQELLQLQHDGKKIDHPVKGSKDVADAMAGVTSTLLGDRSYRKGVVRPRRGDITEQPDVLEPTGTDNVMVVDFGSDRAPQIDTQGLTGAFALNVPPHLRPRERRR